MAPETAGHRPITIQVGSVFDPTWTWYDKLPANGGVPIDLTGWTARAQIRAAHSSATPIATMSTQDGGIVLGGPAGTVAFFLPATVTATYSAPAVGVWDVELTPPAGPQYAFRWVQGTVTFTPEVTR